MCQGSKYHREAARKSEVVTAAAASASPETAGVVSNFDRDAGSSNKGESVKGNEASETVAQDTSNRRSKGNRDTEPARVNIGSREFVRGGRGRLRGRGRAGHQDTYGLASHREVESANQRGSADDASNTRVASASSNTTRTNGLEQKRSGDRRRDTASSKTEHRKLSHEGLVGRQQTLTKVDAIDQGSVQSPSDDRRNKPHGLSQASAGNTPAKDTGRPVKTSAQANRHRTEFYDSRNRGQRIRHTEAGVNSAHKPQEKPPTVSDKAEVNAGKSVPESRQNVARTSDNKGSNEASSEHTSQRKPGEIVWIIIV